MGILGAVLIILMLMMGVWFGCKGEKEGGGQSQYEGLEQGETMMDAPDKAQNAVDQYEEAQKEHAEGLEE